MEVKEQMNDYTGFKVEDFLQDDFFVRSVLHPTEESRRFWKHFQDEGRSEEYDRAVACIRELNKELLEEEEVRTLWRRIRASNHRRMLRSGKVYRLSLGAAVAASVITFFCFHFYRAGGGETGRQDMRAFADKHIPAEEVTETQLIVSEEKIISLAEKESTILYDSASIKVASPKTLQEEISKEEIADFHQLLIPKGKRSFLTLSDGTRIWANSGTRLVYPAEFAGHERKIFVDGEIYIRVQPDRERPFIVQTGDMDIQVLGTEFAVQAYRIDKQQRVVLKSGAVQISSAGSDREPIVLQPAQMYESDGTRAKISTVNVDHCISWIDGLYICEDERLDNLLKRLSRHYGKDFVIDEKAAGLECRGKLDLKESPEEVLKIIQYIAPVKYICVNNQYIVTFNPKQPMEKMK
jgi:ferric-dicitrate binding protein FerR (iron transport regulator)